MLRKQAFLVAALVAICHAPAYPQKQVESYSPETLQALENQTFGLAWKHIVEQPSSFAYMGPFIVQGNKKIPTVFEEMIGGECRPATFKETIEYLRVTGVSKIAVLVLGSYAIKKHRTQVIRIITPGIRPQVSTQAAATPLPKGALIVGVCQIHPEGRVPVTT